jgi:2-aminoadipate transaminase
VLVEDDAYADLRFDGASPTPLLARARDRVFLLGSFSKTLSPGLRVGYVIAPPRWHEAVLAAKSGHDLQASGIGQAIVEQVMARSDFDERLSGLRRFYGLRAERLQAALSRLEGVRCSRPIGGFSIWLETDLPLGDEDFLELAVEEGVCVDPGCLFQAVAGGPEGLSMRLSFSSVPEAEMLRGAERLASALSRARQR